jgi:hypothetical protein
MLPLPALAAAFVLAQAPAAAPAKVDEKKAGDAMADDGSCCRPTPRETDPAKLPQDRKSKLLRDLAQQTTEGRAPFLGDGTLHELEQRVQKLPTNTPPKTAYQLFLNLGIARLDDGNVDGAVAMVGSANADIRSWRLNFELGALVADPAFARRLDENFLRDVADSIEVTLEMVERQGWRTRLGHGIARLLSPIL